MVFIAHTHWLTTHAEHYNYFNTRPQRSYMCSTGSHSEVIPKLLLLTLVLPTQVALQATRLAGRAAAAALGRRAADGRGHRHLGRLLLPRPRPKGQESGGPPQLAAVSVLAHGPERGPRPVAGAHPILALRAAGVAREDGRDAGAHGHLRLTDPVLPLLRARRGERRAERPELGGRESAREASE